MNCPICSKNSNIGMSFPSESRSSNRPLDLNGLPEEYIYVDENWILRLADSKKNCPGYLYLEPRIHAESFPELGEILNDLGRVLKIGMDWIQKNHNPRKIYTVSISEAVPHLHFHLVPHYGSDVKGIDYLKLALGDGLPKL